MKAIGFGFSKSDFRYACLQGEGLDVELVCKERIVYPQNMQLPDLMGWVESQLELILTKNSPDRLAHKISNEISTLDQVKYSCFPQAILNLIANHKNIRIQDFSTRAINGKRLGLSQDVDLMDFVDEKLGKHAPYWDKKTKEAVLVAWFMLV